MENAHLYESDVARFKRKNNDSPSDLLSMDVFINHTAAFDPNHPLCVLDVVCNEGEKPPNTLDDNGFDPTGKAQHWVTC